MKRRGHLQNDELYFRVRVRPDKVLAEYVRVTVACRAEDDGPYTALGTLLMSEQEKDAFCSLLVLGTQAGGHRDYVTIEHGGNVENAPARGCASTNRKVEKENSKRRAPLIDDLTLAELECGLAEVICRIGPMCSTAKVYRRAIERKAAQVKEAYEKLKQLSGRKVTLARGDGE